MPRRRLQAANGVNGDEFGRSVLKLVELPYFNYVTVNRDAQVALCTALGVVPMEVTDQQADVPTDKVGDHDPLNPEGLIAKAFVAKYGHDQLVMQWFWLSMGA
ncbi:TPA: hypothetical protein ACH3X1_007258 [Trebouxia sp. C0004]